LKENVFLRKLKELKIFSVSSGLRIFYSCYADRFGKKRYGDKTPIYNQSLKFIKSILPEAYFIHIIRDGRDVAVSTRNLWFGPGNDIKKQAENWMRRIQRSRKQAEDFPESYLEIRYENLTMNPEAELKKICSAIKIPFEKRMLEYYSNSAQRLNEIRERVDVKGQLITKEQRIGIFEFCTKPPTNERIGRWKKEMTAKEINTFHSVAGNFLREMDYAT